MQNEQDQGGRLTDLNELDALAGRNAAETLGAPSAHDSSLSQVEALLLVFTRSLLNRQDIDVHDDLFTVGGHSLMLTRLTSRIYSAFQVDIPLRKIFETPTIAEIAKCVAETRKAGQATTDLPLIAIQRDTIDRNSSSLLHSIPSYSEERMWFLTMFEPELPVYNISFFIRLSSVNVAALEHSYNMVIERHETMRATYQTEESRLVRMIAPSLTITLPIIDLTQLPEAQQNAAIQRGLERDAQQNFDLQCGPLFRLSLFQLSPEKFVHGMTIHHIITDGWSLNVMFRDITLCYQAFLAGQTPVLPPLPVQYSDYAYWQRQWLTEEVLQEQVAYWKYQLNGLPPILDLPTDFPRQAIHRYEGQLYNFTLPAEQVTALNTLSQREGVTLYMLLLAALSVLLYRYTAQEDILIATPIANRQRVEIENLIGLFVNTLLMRMDLSTDPTFRDLLKRVRETTLNAYANQDLPFEKLVQEIKVQRDLSHSPVFQVMFVLQNAPQYLDLPFNAHDLSGSIGNGSAKFDLFLSMIEMNGVLKGTLEYNATLFKSETIARMIEHFQVLLTSITASVTQPILSLNILPNSEREQILTEWNATERSYPLHKRLPELFDEQVKRTPDAVAIKFNDQPLTYAELNRRSNQLAYYLLKRQFDARKIIGLCVEPSLEMVVGVLGILKAGAAYLPLDPAYPRERLNFMLEDTGVKIVVTHEAAKAVLDYPRLDQRPIELVSLDECKEQLADEPDTLPAANLSEDEAETAYVIYTSGSTGTPKGTLGIHCGVVNNLFWGWETYPYQPDEICCAKTSLSFVDSLVELFSPLLQGIPLIIAPAETLADVRQLVQLLADQHVTRLGLVPSLLRALIEHTGSLQLALPDLTLYRCSGETLPSELAVKFQASAPHARLINVYGSTEVAGDITFYEVERNAPLDAPILLGRPLANNRIYLLNARQQPIPIGVIGELYGGGEGIAQGYLNRPQLTDERFINSPFGRLYRTGDLARYLPDGNIQLVGRRDQQVKIRGYRVELEEVERVICQYPGIQRAASLVRSDAKDYAALVAYFVAAEPVTAAALSAFLRQKLPAYMIPSLLLPIEDMPQTPNGKVNRLALPAPESINFSKVASAPRDALEQRLTLIWEDVLGLHPIGRSDNFFDLGGHSLLAVHLFSRIEKALGHTIPLSKLFQSPTIEQLAAAIRMEKPRQVSRSLVVIQPAGTRPPFFCVHGVGGTVLAYHGLAQYLGPDQPVYGLQARGLEDDTPPDVRIEDMAAHYIAEIQAVQPTGPYHLGGMSFGGLVAYEMARQLVIQGETVELVALLDTVLTHDPSDNRLTMLRNEINQLAERAQFHIKNILRPDNAHKRDYFHKRLKTVRRRLTSNKWQETYAVHQKQKLEVTAPLLSTALQNVKEACWLAARQYHLPVYDGQVTLFQAGDRPVGLVVDQRKAWTGYARGGAEIITVPGNHLTILEEPQVRSLATALTNRLRRFI